MFARRHSLEVKSYNVSCLGRSKEIGRRNFKRRGIISYSLFQRVITSITSRGSKTILVRSSLRWFLAWELLLYPTIPRALMHSGSKFGVSLFAQLMHTCKVFEACFRSFADRLKPASPPMYVGPVLHYLWDRPTLTCFVVGAKTWKTRELPATHIFSNRGCR